MNKVILLGNMGADGELRFTQGGTAVLNLRLATSESYLDREGQRQDRTDWHSVVVWGKRAEGLAKVVRKGSKILVEGSLRTSTYDDRDGNKRYKTEVVALHVELCDKAPSQHAPRNPRASADTPTERAYSDAFGPPQSDAADQADEAAYQAAVDGNDHIPF